MSLMDHTKRELAFAGYTPDSEDDMDRWMYEGTMELMQTFCNQGHSGWSARFAIQLFAKLANYENITPLTGEDDEWNDVSNMNDGRIFYQNKRCSSVFKEGTGPAYRIDGIVFRDPDGCCYTSSQSSVDIEFPWTYSKPIVKDVDVDGVVIES